MGAGRELMASEIQDAGLTPIRQSTIVDDLVHHIRALILAGEVKPGERIVEDHLSERFGVSRPPIREAMRLLEQEGLVQRLPRRGVIVTPLTAADVVEIYTLRAALERLALELIMPLDDPRRLKPLRATIARMRTAARADDREALLDANVDFHLALCELTGHTRLIASYRTLLQQLRLCMAINLRLRREQTGDPREATRRHETLLALIEAGDVDAAIKGFEEHGHSTILDRSDEILAPTETTE